MIKNRLSASDAFGIVKFFRLIYTSQNYFIYNPMTLLFPASRKRTMLVAVALLAAIFVIGGIYFYIVLRNHPSDQSTTNPSVSFTATLTTSPTNSASPTATLTTSPTATVTPSVAEKEFSGLGITFKYNVEDQYGVAVGTKVVGEKVFVGSAAQPDAGGQYSAKYIEVFHKSPGDTIQTAIAKLVLSGYSLSDCKIFVQSNVSGYGYPSTYEMAVVRGYDNKCPVNYITNENGRFFLMDTMHPDLMLFLQQGQTTTFGWGIDLTIK